MTKTDIDNQNEQKKDDYLVKLMSVGVTYNKHSFLYTNTNELFLRTQSSEFETDDNVPKYSQIDTALFMNDNDEIIDIKHGSKHTLFLTKLGSVYAFGSNQDGQCGLGKQIGNVSIPTLIPIANDIKIIKIACGELHSLLIDHKKRLLVFGYNYCGQLGINYNSVQCETKMSHDDDDIDQSEYDQSAQGITAMDDHSDFNSDDDDIRFLMEDTDDDDEDDYDDEYEVYIPTINHYFVDREIKIEQINCGKFHSMVISEKGKCYTFGLNSFGNLGNNKITSYGEGIAEPQEIRLDLDEDVIIDSSSGENHNLLLTKKNKIICFGDNSNNQCCINNKKQIISPYIISKEKELGITEINVVEKVICLSNESRIIVNIYKRMN